MPSSMASPSSLVGMARARPRRSPSPRRSTALGTAALEIMQGAPADADVLRERLAAKARALTSGGRSPTFGYGLVQASTSCGIVTAAQ